jgi:hypothetical protein
MAAYTTIDDPSEHNQGLFFTGTGSAHKISYDGNAESYIPDIYFVKNMGGSDHPEHTDSIRTGGITSANEQAGYGSRDIDILDELASDGYTVGAAGQGNGNGRDMMVLTWNAGSTATITTTGNNITSVNASGSAVAHSYSVNTTAKQSMVSYEATGSNGLEVPHHLGVKPTFAMFRKLGAASGWGYYAAGPFTFYKDMTANGATDGMAGGYHSTGWWYSPSGGPSSGSFFSAAPDSTKHTLGGHGYTNDDDYDYICYSFSDLQGYFKTGFYEGTGDADGPFVYTGFEPEMILINPQDNGTNPTSNGNLGKIVGYYGGWYWFVNGMTRNGFNPHDKTWNMPESSNMHDYDQDALDIYSNGFKIRAPGGDVSGGWQAGNQVDKTVWYAAWAKHPFVTSDDGGGIPNTAK